MNKLFYINFEAFVVMTVLNGKFWVVTPLSLVGGS
jgi:hypothetical protein